MKNQDQRPRKVIQESPLTFKELSIEITERLKNITNEFKEGFDFIKTYNKSVTFFGSARTLENEKEYQKAKSLAGRIVKELNYTIVTGGGPGIMESANRGAFENGGNSVGFTIKLPMEQVTNSYLTSEQKFYYFFSRKVCMSFSAEAYVYLPGGFGTFDELFEILTLVQTNKIEKVPIILYGNNDFWNKFDSFVKENLLKNETIDSEDTELYIITEDENLVMNIIKNAPIRTN